MSQTLKSFRVSYYLENEIRTDGRVPLLTSFIHAEDAEKAKAKLQDIYLSRPDLVILNAYEDHHFGRLHDHRRIYTVKPTVRQQAQTVTATANSNTTIGVDSVYPATLRILMGTPRTFEYNPYGTTVTPFKGEIIRPAGPCKWHPNAILETDGRCPVLDSSVYSDLPASRYPSGPDYTVLKQMVEDLPPLPKCPWHPDVTLDAQGQCHAPDPSDTVLMRSGPVSDGPGDGQAKDSSFLSGEKEIINPDVVGPEMPKFVNATASLLGVLGAPIEDPCVSQEVKDEVYAKCEAEKKVDGAFLGTCGLSSGLHPKGEICEGWVPEPEPKTTSLSNQVYVTEESYWTPGIPSPQEWVDSLHAKELAKNAAEGALAKKRSFWNNPFSYVELLAGAMLLYGLFRLFFKH